MAQPDAVKAAPEHYTVQAENDQVRVLRVRYGGGEKSVMHSHPAAVAIFLTDGHARFSDEQGNTQEMQGKAEDTVLMPATTHTVENLTQKPINVILIELKG